MVRRFWEWAVYGELLLGRGGCMGKGSLEGGVLP